VSSLQSKKISVRYPVVAATGLVVFCWCSGRLRCLLKHLVWTFCSWLLALSLIDLDTMTLPNPLTQSGLVAGLVFKVAAGFIPEANGELC